MWGESKAQRALVVVGIPALAVFGGVGGAAAQPIFEPTFSDSQLCVTADFENALLQGPIQYSDTVAVDLPAGEVVIPEAISYDDYTNRADTPTQLSERWEVEFLDADGNVIATSDATPDVADGVQRAEFIGALGSVTLTEPAVAVRAHHRTDLPPDPSPNSVYASGVTLCWEEGLTPPVCTDDDGNAIEANADGTCPSPPEVCLDTNGDPLTDEDGTTLTPDDNGECPAPTSPQCVDADGDPLLDSDGDPVVPDDAGECPSTATPQCLDADGNTLEPSADGTCPTATPQCLDGDGNALEPSADGSCPPAGPLTPQCVDSDGAALTPNDDGTCPVVTAPPPAGPTVPGQAPTPSPSGQLPVTGSQSTILLLSGLWLVAAGGTATLFVRSRMTPTR